LETEEQRNHRLRGVEVEQGQQAAARWNARLQLEDPDGGWQAEAPVPRTAWIHDGHDHIHNREQRAVGMTIDNDLSERECRVEPLRGWGAKLVAMGHDDVEALQLELGHLRQPPTDVLSIGIAIHRGDRGQGLEFGEQINWTQVTGVEDVIYFGERAEYFRTQQAMGVRDDSKPYQRPAMLAAGVPT
jgi:hypothetical protein